ncbi:MAG: beta propeller repeat protein [Acidimicrobiales bacterium]
MSPSTAQIPPDDDPIVERLRETLRLEAEAVAPFTGRLRSIAAIHDWRARRQAARRRVATAVAAVAAVAVIGVSAAVVANQPVRSTAVGVGGGPVSQPLLHPQTQNPATKPAVSKPVASGGLVPMPANFAPLSATFVTTRIGYVLGTVPCSRVRCLELAGTLDGGGTWRDLGVPDPSGTTPLALPTSGAVDLSMRFSDQSNGWIYGHVDTQYVLWWTGDAGASWQAVGQAQTEGGVVTSLEATAQRAEAAVVRAPGGDMTMISSPQAAAAWKTVSPTLPAGGSNPSTDLVLQGHAGWVVDNAPTFVAGARLSPSGGWTSWKPICATGTRVQLAAVSAHVLFEECQASTGAATVYQSTNGGTSWFGAGQGPAGLKIQGFAAASQTTLAVAGRVGNQTVIELSENAGANWTIVWRGSGTVTQLGFEDPAQGIALVASGSRAELLMTYFYGRAWSQRDFQLAPLSP